MPPQIVSYRAGERELKVAYRVRQDGRFWANIGGRDCQAEVFAADAAGIDFAIDGRRQRVAVTSIGARHLVQGPGGDLELLEQPRFPSANRSQAGGGLKAPMPGKVLAVEVVQGQAVEKGQLLMILEAMKMEHRITAPATGVVKALAVAVGEQVANGALLVTFEEQSRKA